MYEKQRVDCKKSIDFVYSKNSVLFDYKKIRVLTQKFLGSKIMRMGAILLRLIKILFVTLFHQKSGVWCDEISELNIKITNMNASDETVSILTVADIGGKLLIGKRHVL